MKLLTEIRAQEPDGVVYACGHCVTTEYLEPKAFEAVAHDAAVTHALMQAMVNFMQPLKRQAVLDRADELMRQWGFTDE